MSVKPISPALTALLNKVDPPSRIMFHCVPLRVVRVVAVDEAFKSFRVEQLVMTGRDMNDPKGHWKTLSAHSSPIMGESYQPAAQAAVKAQNDLRYKLTKRVAGNHPSGILRP